MTRRVLDRRQNLVKFLFLNLEFDDGRQDPLVKNILSQDAGGGIFYERRQRVPGLEFDPKAGHGPGDPFYITKARAQKRPSHLDGDPDLSFFEPERHLV